MIRSAFDTIIFDLDGTLVDTSLDLTASLNHALVALGRQPVPPPSVRAMVGQGARKLVERGLTATGGLSAPLVDEGVALFMDYYGRHIADHSQPFPGVDATLQQLANGGWKLAVCTNKPEKLARQLIATLGWEHRFAALAGADSFAFRKPDPRHLLETLALAGGSRPLFVGDSRTDADTARAAGVPLVLVTFGYSTEPLEAMGADHLIDDFAELLPIIKDWPIQTLFSDDRATGTA